ncbi:hypothetical protein PybrP1_008700 [[Pythium] brassicae (nom. inval.)]|nr:hypothetical protein PybrP1_008700 [[Pythium] brassicae (nom. inval.)]
MGFTTANADLNPDKINAIVAISCPAGNTADCKVKYEIVGKCVAKSAACPALTTTEVTVTKATTTPVDASNADMGFTTANADANPDKINAIVAISCPAGNTADCKVKYEIGTKIEVDPSKVVSAAKSALVCTATQRANLLSAKVVEVNGININVDAGYRSAASARLSVASIKGVTCYEPTALTFGAKADAHPDKTIPSFMVECTSTTTDCSIKYEIIGECVTAATACPALTGTAVAVKKGEKLDLDVTKFVDAVKAALTCTATTRADIVSAKIAEVNGGSLSVDVGYQKDATTRLSVKLTTDTSCFQATDLSFAAKAAANFDLTNAVASVTCPSTNAMDCSIKYEIVAQCVAKSVATPTARLSMNSTTTHPVVLIHGVFGYGRRRPLWNSWAPYWPEHALAEMHAQHFIVDVGALSSDHDRACEAFFQLFGGTVDYGEQHACDAGHNRFGATFYTPLHPNWSAANPVHLLGHSFGATTAVELYQLLCQDYFGVGSDCRWVRSITSIAGPLSGTTLTYVFGLHDAEMRAFTLGHAIGAALGLWFKLHTDFPVLKNIFDFRMPQWECVRSYREVLSATGRINMSSDLAVYNILPALRLERNSRLVHMDKVFLASVTTSSHAELPLVELALVGAVLLVGVGGVGLLGSSSQPVFIASAAAAIALTVLARQLAKRLQNLDYATIPSLYAGMLLISRRVRTLHEIFHGFERSDWELNDGAVNIHSMLRAWTPATISQADACVDEKLGCSDYDSSGELDSTRPELPLFSPHCRERLHRGRWYVHRVRKNHMAGTHFDRDAPQLFRDLLHVISSEFERD